MLFKMFQRLFVCFRAGPFPFHLVEARFFLLPSHIYHGNLDKLLNLQLTIGTVPFTCHCASRDIFFLTLRLVSAQPLAILHYYLCLTTPQHLVLQVLLAILIRSLHSLDSCSHHSASSWLLWAKECCFREQGCSVRGMFRQEEIRKAWDIGNRFWNQTWGAFCGHQNGTAVSSEQLSNH